MWSARRLLLFYICVKLGKKYPWRYQSYGADTNDGNADGRADGYSKFRTV